MYSPAIEALYTVRWCRHCDGVGSVFKCYCGQQVLDESISHRAAFAGPAIVVVPSAGVACRIAIPLTLLGNKHPSTTFPLNRFAIARLLSTNI